MSPSKIAPQLSHVLVFSLLWRGWAIVQGGRWQLTVSSATSGSLQVQGVRVSAMDNKIDPGCGTMLQIALKNDEGCAAQLCLNARQLKRFSSLAPKLIRITNCRSAGRPEIESFIDRIYRRCYGAEIQAHYATILSVHREDNTILGALGFRFARQERLFLEQYLDAPVEQILCNAYNEPVVRDTVTEIGNLASLGGGASIFLFTALNAYLDQQGMKFSVITGTTPIRRYFSALGFNVQELARADRSRLIGNGAAWGHYYDEDPRVIAGNVGQALSCLQKRLHLTLSASDAASALEHSRDP